MTRRGTQIAVADVCVLGLLVLKGIAIHRRGDQHYAALPTPAITWATSRISGRFSAALMRVISTEHPKLFTQGIATAPLLDSKPKGGRHAHERHDS